MFVIVWVPLSAYVFQLHIWTSWQTCTKLVHSTVSMLVNFAVVYRISTFGSQSS